ncbi:MAG: serine protease [bacterium]|nr:serine protease [bacterium]
MHISGKTSGYFLGILVLVGGTASVFFDAERVHAQISPSTIPSTFYFTRTLASGARGEDVRYLQILLNRDVQTQVSAAGVLGGLGTETTYFGGATRRAVINFQNKYAAEVLRPAGLQSGTGSVGPFTRIKLNTLLAASRVISTPLVLMPPTPTSLSVTGVATTTPAPTAPLFSFDELNTKTRMALVNILCTTKRSGSFNPISGSGVIVEPRGVILTNAHIGQYFLLKDYLVPDFLECLIRTGSPARNSYKAKLLYISPEWVEDNAKKIQENEPTGTGKNDFALLLITGSTDPNVTLPATYPYLPMDLTNESIRAHSDVLAAAYPAGLLSGITIQRDLYPSSAVVQTGTVYDFSDYRPDIFSIGGSVVAQHGASGGAVVNQSGKLIGLIVTASTGETTAERDLNALTMSHIDDSFRARTGDNLQTLLDSNLTASAESFNANVFPGLKKLLEGMLSNQ